MQVSKNFPEGCTFFDVVLQCYFSLNLTPKFILDNNITDLNLVTTANQSFVYDTDLVYDEFLSNEAAAANYRYCTGELKVNSNSARTPYLLIESSDILSTEANNRFLT